MKATIPSAVKYKKLHKELNDLTGFIALRERIHIDQSCYSTIVSGKRGASDEMRAKIEKELQKSIVATEAAIRCYKRVYESGTWSPQ